MSSNADTIKDFLVSLGFDIDQSGASEFEAVLKGVTANVMKVGAAVEGAALSIVGFTTRIANGLDKIYWASQRTGASIQGIKALGYVASQTGASAESAMSSLEGLAGFMRSNPGAEGFLNRLGVQTRDASGKMRDTASIFTGVGQKLNNMPYYRAKQYAQMLGIDENTLMAMRRGMNGFTADYQSMLQKTGFNADKAAVQSNKFMTSMRGLTSLFGIMRDKIGSNLAGGLAGSLDSLRRRILDNFPKIEETLTKVIKGVIWLANAFTRMAWRVIQAAGSVIDWWKKLDDGSQKFLMTIGAILIAWRLLNAAFLKSPIGLITTLILAIGLLYDDYQTWREGGNSLIDWEKWQPAIDKAKEAMVWLRDHLLELKDSIGGWKTSLELLATFIAGAWISKVTGAFARLAGIPMPPWLKGWMAYAAYLYDDRENIVASAQSSIDYAKQNIGDGMRALGIDTDFGRNPHTVKGANIQPDIPGAEPVQHAQSAKRTLADRNNNPGNIRPVRGNGFRFFESALHGWEAMKNQLMRYFTGKTTGRALQTIQDIVSTWAPAGDNNDPKKYAQDVAKWMGVSPNTVLNLANPETMAALMQSMARKEGYSNWNSPLAYQAAGGSLNQQTVINVHGVNNPQEAANLIADKQGAVNARAVQQLKGPA
ncbi:lytic transglycosylase catalytic [Salmonella enterica subsp. enterica]|nr:lytic transglycosylase catalytic [Salmonella enterica subsp. enterica serovar Eastbourne]